MSWDDDDIEVGGNEELLGESHRGLQDADYIGAAKQLKRALGAFAQARANRHAPLTRRLKSPYKDSTQLGINATVTIGTLGTALTYPSSGQTLTGVSRIYKTFKPSKVVIVESCSGVFRASGLSDVTVYATQNPPVDVLVTGAFTGADNCFPNAPSATAAVNAATWANDSLGVGISWPSLNRGDDVTMNFLVRGSIVSRLASPGSSYALQVLTINIDVTLLGPQLR